MANYSYNYDKYDEKPYIPPKLATNRSIWKLLILSVLTLGIYSIIFFVPLSFDLNKAAPKEDRTKTMNYLTAYILSFFTFSIVLDIWLYQVTVHIEEGLARYGIDYKFGRRDFWIWGILGSFIVIGPIINLHKLCKAMNLICKAYNEKNALN